MRRPRLIIEASSLPFLLVGDALGGFGEGHFPGLFAAASLSASDGGPRISVGDVAEVALANLVRGDVNLHSVNFR